VIAWLLGEKALILRMAGAAMVSFVVVCLLGPRMIRFLMKAKLGDRPEFNHADLNELASHKSNTPTMGGLLIVVAILVSLLLFADMGNMYIRMALLALIWLGTLGAVDDWMKLKRPSGSTSRHGLYSWEKMLFQVGLALLLGVALWKHGQHNPVVTDSGELHIPAHTFYFPFKAHPVALPLVVYLGVVIVTMVGSSNAVNLTDGMDGLASGCMAITCSVFLLIAWIVGVTEWAALFHLPLVPGSAEMTVLCASMFGACLGFLWYNAHPAQMFMGDTGSLPLGGLLGYVAVVTRQELMLLIAGGVFVMEALSVMLQVGYFKMTRPGPGLEGKRLFRCAPIHHHFHLIGWPENKVVVRFWLLGIIFAALALATLKLR
jgi:phospho-N-acetylmuramoyl-pentapeptide-transferase